VPAAVHDGMSRLMFLVPLVAGCAAAPSVVETPRPLTPAEEQSVADRIRDTGDVVTPLGLDLVFGAQRLDVPVPVLELSATPRRVEEPGGRSRIGPMCLASTMPSRSLGGTTYVDRCPREATLVFAPTADGHATRIELWVQEYAVDRCDTTWASPMFMSSTRCTLVPDGGPAGDPRLEGELAAFVRATFQPPDSRPHSW
jgi:hypothetical protein